MRWRRPASPATPCSRPSTRRVTTRANPFGVAGTRWLVEDGEGTPEIGCGHHGGLGPGETRPFLTFIHPDFGQGEAGRTTSLVDIAPTILRFLGEPVDGMDGAPIAA